MQCWISFMYCRVEGKNDKAYLMILNEPSSLARAFRRLCSPPAPSPMSASPSSSPDGQIEGVQQTETALENSAPGTGTEETKLPPTATLLTESSGEEVSARLESNISVSEKPDPVSISAAKDVSLAAAEKSLEKPVDKVEDETSASPTLNSSHRRQAQMSSTTEMAVPESPKTRSRPKPTFFSRLVRILVPCIPSPSRSQPIEIDESEIADQPSTTEKTKVIKEAIEAPTSTATSPSHSPEASTSAPVPLPLSIPSPTDTPPNADGDILLPPTPTNQLLPRAETEGMTSGAVVPPGSSGTIDSKRSSHYSSHRQNGSPADGEESEGTSSFTDDDEVEENHNIDEIEDEEDRLISNGGAGIPIGPDGVPRPLLPPIAPQHAGRKCLVLDLDETLVHSSFKSIPQADYVVPVEIEYTWHNVYVIKRPGVDNFLKKMGELYEIVVFTASLSKYADPVLDRLDVGHTITHRLFRESCYNHKGNYVKDLSQLGRPISDTIILDNSPASYIFHPNNAVPVSSWFNDPHDTELTDLVPFLGDLGAVDDVRGVLDGAR
ncbi:hypothetical protein D9757_004341 [Collybiopsis confluens]|uniref:FCP1 homology domain-containing protein n=1 Tax=Collybiopsis confluens TaxID=2823264 RepID=A0A8H5HTV4_9AGAR|nr:hypothetical protein D9757_004341 [Collybiopsis confluens]